MPRSRWQEDVGAVIPFSSKALLRIGQIADIDTSRFTATVILTDTGDVLPEVPWRTPYGSSLTGAGYIFQPDIDSRCVVEVNDYDGIKQPYIVSFMPASNANTASTSLRRPYKFLDAGSEGGIHSKTNAPDGAPFAGAKYADLLPGDQILTSIDGAAVGAFAGRVAGLRASELAQIMLFGQDDLMRTVARNQQNFSDRGEVDSFNNEDNIEYHEFESNVAKEGRHEKYRMRLYKHKVSGQKKGSGGIGDPPDTENLFFLQLNQIKYSGETPETEVPVAEVCFDINGGLQVRSATEIKSEIIKTTTEGFAALMGGVVGVPGPTGTHGGDQTTEQDPSTNAGAEVYSVIHQTATGEIHIRDNWNSTLDFQKENISFKCNKVFRVVCDKVWINSRLTDWNNDDLTVHHTGDAAHITGTDIDWTYGQSMSTKCRTMTDTNDDLTQKTSKTISREAKTISDKAKELTRQGDTISDKGAISHN